MVEWKSVINQSLDHSGSLCLQWLKDNCYTSSALTRKAKEMEPVIGTEVSWEPLPLVGVASVHVTCSQTPTLIMSQKVVW